MSKRFTFKEKCDNCNGQPIYRDLGLCSVCTHGEASSMWSWLDDGWTGKERKLAIQHLDQMLPLIADDEGNVDPIRAGILHVDQEVLDKIEAIL